MINRAIFKNAALVLTISSNQTNLNLRTYANGQGYVGGPITLVLTMSLVNSAGTGAAALDTGTWPSGVIPEIDVSSGTNVEGAGGAGGNGQANPCQSDGVGLPGGTAFNASALCKLVFRGTFAGGGGGGGAGAASIQACCPAFAIAGGGGGGGQGNAGGAGGAGRTGSLGTASSPGGNGTSGAPGGGGAGGQLTSGCCPPIIVDGIAGESGGAFGAAGTAGSFAGGAAGHSITGNANITFLVNTGTLIGPVA